MTESSTSGGRGWAWAVAALLVAVLLHVASWALLPFVLAGIVAFVTDPLVCWLVRRLHAPRWAVAGAVYIGLVVAFGALAVATASAAVHDLMKVASAGTGPLQSALQGVLGPGGVELFGRKITAGSIVTELSEAVQRASGASALAKLARPAFAASVGVALFAVLSFYMMVSGPSLASGARWIVPPAQRAGLDRVLPAMVRASRRYFIGVLAVVVFTAIFAWLGYGLVLRVPRAALLAVVVGVLETVPVIGPIIAAGLVGLSALQLHSLAKGAVMVGYAMALRLAIDDVVAPVVLGRSVTVHPVVVMLAYVLGAVLFGVPGLLLAVPASACLRIWLTDRYESKTSSAS